jgi:hypothetical protein
MTKPKIERCQRCASELVFNKNAKPYCELCRSVEACAGLVEIINNFPGIARRFRIQMQFALSTVKDHRKMYPPIEGEDLDLREEEEEKNGG